MALTNSGSMDDKVKAIHHLLHAFEKPGSKENGELTQEEISKELIDFLHLCYGKDMPEDQKENILRMTLRIFILESEPDARPGIPMKLGTC